MDFEGDLREEILAFLPVKSAKFRQELVTLSTQSLLIRFLTWRKRLVHPHPRRVHRSPEFVRSLEASDNIFPIRYTLARVAAGLDVNPFLSRQLISGFEGEAKSTKHRADLDGLLTEWGMHHLHPGTEYDTDGFIKRVKTKNDILIVIYFTKTDAYVVDIINHYEWTAPRLAEICIKNWPKDRIFVELSGVLAPLPQDRFSSQQNLQLRNAGITSPVYIGDRVYIPQFGGVTTARTPTEVSYFAARLLRQITFFSENKNCIRSEFKKLDRYRHRIWPLKPSYRLKHVVAPDKYTFAIYEEKSNLYLGLTV